MHVLLADVAEGLARVERWIEDDDRLGTHRAVLRSAEGEGIDADVGRHLLEGAAEAGSRVRDACAVEIDIHVELMRCRGDRPQLVQGVPRSVFSGLGDQHDPRLGVVEVADAPMLCTYEFRGDLGVSAGHRDDLRAEQLLRCASLIDVNVGRGRADHAFPAAQHRLHAHDVGTRAVEDRKDLSVLTELASDQFQRPGGPRIGAVGNRMIGVGGGDRFEHARMHPGMIVTGKGAHPATLPTRR